MDSSDCRCSRQGHRQKRRRRRQEGRQVEAINRSPLTVEETKRQVILALGILQGVANTIGALAQTGVWNPCQKMDWNALAAQGARMAAEANKPGYKYDRVMCSTK